MAATYIRLQKNAELLHEVVLTVMSDIIQWSLDLKEHDVSQDLHS